MARKYGWKSILACSLLAAALAVFVGIDAPARASNILTNGDFENMPAWGGGMSHDDGFTLLTGEGDIPGWTIEPGYGVTVHNTLRYPYIGAQYSINLDAEAYNSHNANIYQDFSTVAGASYILSFDWKGWTSGTAGMKASVTDTVTGVDKGHNTYYYIDSVNVYTAYIPFTGTGNTFRLRFEEYPASGDNDNIFILDNVAVNPVPLPSALLFVVPGMAFLGVVRRRVRK